jgi:hypothetical protein
MNDAAACGYRHRLSAIGRAQFLHDVFEVNLNGIFGDKRRDPQL